MGLNSNPTDSAMLVNIRPGQQRGIVICWGCKRIFLPCEVTEHHKIPRRYELDPNYHQVVQQYAEDEDIDNGLLVPVCYKCHGEYNHLDKMAGLTDSSTLDEWLEYWTAEGRNLGKDMFCRGNRLVGQSPNARMKGKGPKRLRRK